MRRPKGQPELPTEIRKIACDADMGMPIGAREVRKLFDLIEILRARNLALENLLADVEVWRYQICTTCGGTAAEEGKFCSTGIHFAPGHFCQTDNCGKAALRPGGRCADHGQTSGKAGYVNYPALKDEALPCLRKRGHSGLAYGSPSPGVVAPGEIVSGIEIGVVGVAATPAGEEALGAPVFSRNVAAAALLRGVPGVYLDDPDASPGGDVTHLRLQRGERPALLDQALLLRGSDTAADVPEIFLRNHAAAGAKRLSYDAVGHVPQLPLDGAMLPPGQPLQEPALTAALVPCLEGSSLPEVLAAELLDRSALEDLPRVRGGDAVDPRVDPEHAGSGRVGHLLLGYEVQVPATALARESSRPGKSPRSVEVPPVEIGDHQPDSGSLAEGAEGRGRCTEIKGHGARVVAYTRAGFPPVGLPWLGLALVGLGDDSAGGAGKVGREPGSSAHVAVGKMVESDGVLDAGREGHSGSLVESFDVGDPHGFEGGFRFHRNRQLQLQGRQQLHIGNIGAPAASRNSETRLLPAL